MLSPSVSATCQALSASLAEFVTYPIALIRTREQAHLASPKAVLKYRNLFATILNLYKTDGLKSLYRGVWSSMITASLSWGAFRYIYEHLDAIKFSSKNFTNCMSKSVISSLITTSLVHPFWIARLSLQLESSKAKMSGWVLCGNCPKWLYRTYMTQGVAGLFRGYTASFTAIPQISIQMTIYEYLRSKRLSQENTALNTYLPIVYGSFSRLCGSFCTYPVMVTRAQMQCQLSPFFQRGILRNLIQTYKLQKLPGLYVGFRFQILRSLLYGLVFYTSYEVTTKLADKVSNDL